MGGRSGQRRRHPYRLAIDPEADRAFGSLKSTLNSCFHELTRFMDSLRDNPIVGEPMTGEWAGYRRAHVCRDRYRIVWEIAEDAVYVERIGLRRNVYDS